jgi:TRAP-type C4-dicarboxylate transport system substrate-binding protein
VALVLQWHTKVKYVTKVPLVYTFGFMAVDKKTFDSISDADKAIVTEVMTRTYENFNKVNLVDNQGAYDALLKSGIEAVKFDDEEFVKVRNLLLESNLQQGVDGAFSLELYQEMLQHIDEYRSGQVAASE